MSPPTPTSSQLAPVEAALWLLLKNNYSRFLALLLLLLLLEAIKASTRSRSSTTGCMSESKREGKRGKNEKTWVFLALFDSQETKVTRKRGEILC